MSQAKDTNRTKKFQYGNVITISLAHMVHDIYSSFLSPVLPLLISKLGISYSLSSLLSVFQRLPSILNPLIGMLADRISLRYLIIISPSITAIVMSLLGIAPSYAVLTILLLIMGISSAFFHVPAPVMVRKVSGLRVGMGMSFYMLGGELARTLGPLIILGAVSLWGFENSYWLIPFGMVASLLLFFKLRNVIVVDEFQKKQKNEQWGETIKHYSKFFIAATGFLLFSAFLKSSLTFYLPTYLNLEGKTLWAGGIALSVFQMAGAGGTLISGTISDKIGRRNMLLISSISAPVFMMVFIFLRDTIFAFPALILLGMAVFSSQPVLLALVNNLPSDRPAFLNGIYMTITFIVGSLAVMLVGVIADFTSLQNTYQLTVFVALAAVPFVFLIDKK